MVAVFSWVEYNANATDTGVATNLNFGSANSRNLTASANPITAGTYSFSKWVRGNWTGTFTSIENLQFFASDTGPYVTGELIRVSATTTGSYAGTSTFATPVSSADSKAVHLLAQADPASANVGFGGVLANSLIAPGYSDFMVLQMSVTTAAGPGPVNQKTFTLQYDET